MQRWGTGAKTHSCRSNLQCTKLPRRMPQVALLCLLVAALTFVHNVSAQTMNGCVWGGTRDPLPPYPTPVLVGATVDLPATYYFDNMACSFILDLNLSSHVYNSTLSFSKFQTEQGYDFVEVYDGCNPSRPRGFNSSAAPCSLVQDFPFRLMRTSGVYRCGAPASLWRVRRYNITFIHTQVSSRRPRRAHHHLVLRNLRLDSFPY